MVSIPGGEPLLHPEIDEIVRGLVARKKYVYLCTNALLLEEKLDLFTPEQVPHLQRAPGRPARASTTPRSAARASSTSAVRGDPRGAGARLPRHHQHHALRRRRLPSARAQFFDCDDGARRRGHDGLAGLRLREGARPGALPAGASAPWSSSASVFAGGRRAALALQPVAALPRVPAGRARLRLHAVGHARPTRRLRLAEALLPAARTATRRASAS